MILLRTTMRGLTESATALRELAARVADPRPVLSAFKASAIGSIQENFEVGGRPTPWWPSGRAMKWARVGNREYVRGMKTLVKKGTLLRSVSGRLIGRDTLGLGSNVRYAAVHHFGINQAIQIPEHIRRVTKAFGRKLATPTYARVRAHSAHMRIVARPYLLLQPEDLDRLGELLLRHATGGTVG